MFVDTKYHGTVYPNYKPRLYDFEGKDPVAKENSGHVSMDKTSVKLPVCKMNIDFF